LKPNVAAIQGGPNGPTATRADSHWPEILAAVEDRSVPPAEVVRLILMEMSLVCHELRTVSGHSSLEFKLKPLLAEVHALRILAQTTRRTSELAVQTAPVNLDGAAYYLVGAVTDVFKESALQAGCSDHVWRSILTFFRDNIGRRQEEIWRKMEEIAATPEEAEAFVRREDASNKPATNSPGEPAAEHPAT